MKIASVKALVVIIRGEVDSGAEMPKRGYRVFTNRPTNITNATLTATDRDNSTAALSVFIRRARRMTNPGKNVRKTKPTHCLRIGTSRKTEAYKRIYTASTNMTALRIISYPPRKEHRGNKSIGSARSIFELDVATLN
jgi:hypothetical protein